MSCADLKRWLDGGMPPQGEAAARGHASRCEPCSTLLRAQREIDALLGGDRAERLRDHSRFVDQVMERVVIAGSPERRIELWAASPLPWWIQAATDPAAVLACVLAALLYWRIDWLLVLTRFVGVRWSVFAGPALTQARSAIGLDRPGVALGVELLALLALGWISFHLYRWSERLARRSAGA